MIFLDDRMHVLTHLDTLTTLAARTSDPSELERPHVEFSSQMTPTATESQCVGNVRSEQLSHYDTS